MFSGFELYSMVPSICPLETLHNSLSLKQVDDFLSSIAMFHDQVLDISASSPAVQTKKVPLNTYTPAKVLPCPFTQSLGKKTPTSSPERSASVQDSCPARKLKVSDHNKSDSKNVHQDCENEQPKAAVAISIPSAAECYDCTIKINHNPPAYLPLTVENKTTQSQTGNIYKPPPNKAD